MPLRRRAAPAVEAPSDPAEELSPEAQLEARVVELEEQALRARADYQNLQRRLMQERAEAIRMANADLVKALLPVLDDFERSLAAAAKTDNLQSVVEGQQLIHANLLKVLRDHGLEPIDALHQPFDPNVHEALLQTPSDEHPPLTVLEEVGKGYRLKDRVLRPTKVVVSQAPPAAADAGAGDESGEAGEEK